MSIPVDRIFGAVLEASAPPRRRGAFEVKSQAASPRRICFVLLQRVRRALSVPKVMGFQASLESKTSAVSRSRRLDTLQVSLACLAEVLLASPARIRTASQIPLQLDPHLRSPYASAGMPPEPARKATIPFTAGDRLSPVRTRVSRRRPPDVTNHEQGV